MWILTMAKPSWLAAGVQVLVLSLMFHEHHHVAATADADEVCESSRTRRMTGELRPKDLPAPVLFTSFQNSTISDLPVGRTQLVAQGIVNQIHKPNSTSVDAKVSVLPSLVDRNSVNKMLDLLRNHSTFDQDPDSVDAMPTYELFIDSPDLHSGMAGGGMKVLDSDPTSLAQRRALRKQIMSITKPLLEERITPFVQSRYPEACAGKGHMRNCTPCYSLIRRYKHGERQSHAIHHDGHALVTVVVSLSDYGSEYRGGLYVSAEHGQKQFLALNKGDAVVHQSILSHGVQVYDLQDRPTETERWSWILWYRDSDTCDDYSHEWFVSCAADGNPLCQHLHSTKVENLPGITQAQAVQQFTILNIAAAKGGVGIAAMKIARAYLHMLPSHLPYNEEKAKEYFQMAVEYHDPEGHFGLAQLITASVAKVERANRGDMEQNWKDTELKEAIRHLEEGALLGHAFSMFNLGIAHVFGYGTGRYDYDLAGEWLEQSGIPEGYYVASVQAGTAGDVKRQKILEEKAIAVGYRQPWRKKAREYTGSGGAGGVELDMVWPTNMHGRVPPQF
jgi:TPR repeat protein